MHASTYGHSAVYRSLSPRVINRFAGKLHSTILRYPDILESCNRHATIERLIGEIGPI